MGDEHGHSVYVGVATQRKHTSMNDSNPNFQFNHYNPIGAIVPAPACDSGAFLTNIHYDCRSEYSWLIGDQQYHPQEVKVVVESNRGSNFVVVEQEHVVSCAGPHITMVSW